MRAKPAKHKTKAKSVAKKSAKAKPVAKKSAKPSAKRAIASADAEVGRRLLAQALETPGDDLPRLVYADWLEEQGHPLAELIRTSCDAAKATGASRTALDKRVTALASKHRRNWIQDAKLREDLEIDRGMVKRLFMRTSEYGSKARQAELLPMVSLLGVTETTMYKPFSRLGSCETLAWTSELSWIDCQLDDDKLATLLESPYLTRIRALELEKLRCTDRGLGALARAKTLPRLRHLSLPNPVHLGMYSIHGVLAVLEAHALEGLRLMGVNSLEVDELVASPAASKLRHASFDGRHTGAIVASRHLTSLESLELQSLDSVTDADVAPLLTNPALAKLRSLRIRLWSTSPWVKKPSPAMVAKLRARFGAGLTYKDHY